VLAAMLALVLASQSGQAVPTGVVADIRVQGNLATSDDEVRRLAEVEIGMPAGPATADEVAARLRATKRFERVEVRQRFASIADPTQVALVIIVDEGPVHIELTGDPAHPTRVVRNRGPRLLILPVLDAEDGYGVSYGARLALADPLGSRSRISFPLTWGGEKLAAVEADKQFAEGPLTRLMAGGSIGERTNPFYDRADDRQRLWLRGEHAITPSLRIGAAGGWQHVTFAGLDDTFAYGGADVIIDTRIDPMLSRNAVYARAGWERLGFSSGAVSHTTVDARGYIGLFAQNILVVRAFDDAAAAPLPAFAQPLLGGMDTLRGFRAGTAAADNVVSASAEVLVPLTSPLKLGKMGVSVFTDLGTAYDHGQRLADQPWLEGIGGGIWFSAAFLRLNVDVAHGLGAGTRVHVGGGLSF
jgi:outer membrane protein assembly factor BamA